MAIPKEPRQIMINIMYLVLTALLALNVSAEIFNAFKVVDKGLESSSLTLEEANAKLPAEIERLSRKKTELAVYADRAQPARSDAKAVVDKIDDIIEHMITESGGYLENGNLNGEQDKNITTNYLVKEGKANELKDEIFGLRDKMLTYIDEKDRNAFMAQLDVNIDTTSWREQKTKKRNWAQYTFDNMPLQAVLPILHKYKNDVQNGENAVLNYLMGKVGGEDVVLDKFQVVAVPKKSYVIKGEPYEAEIFLSASAGGTSNTGLSISVNGSSLKTDDGVGKYVVGNNSSTGVKKYTAKISVTNPTTGEVKSYESLFEYEVGERSVSVSADKMNVLYVGVDNPLSVSAAGISSNDMKVSGSGAGLNVTKTASGKYNARVSSQGTATVTVSGGGLTPTNFEYRTKFVPTPIPKLSTYEGGNISNGVFKAQNGVIPVLENFDFDLRCNIKGFQIVKISKTGDPKTVVNPGQSYNGAAQSLVSSASPGDVFLFQNIKCSCPGWPADKKLSELTFNIQ